MPAPSRAWRAIASARLRTSCRCSAFDPRLTGDYLAAVDTDERTDALALHFLRALGRRKGEWGDSEGVLFESIAEDTARRAPVRCWAVQAQSRSSRWRQHTLMDSAEAETDPLVRRAKFATLKKLRPEGGRRARFLQHMRGRFPDLVYTARWLDAA